MAAEKPDLDTSVARYYAQAPEEERLQYGAAILEEARTRELIHRHAPGPPAVVLDIGGGAGAYAFWLAGLGYGVHLVDATPRLIEEAQRRAAGRQPLASARVGDARALDFPDGSADIALLLGPLYHLTDPADRGKALVEANRVLKPGGWLFAAVISRWASLLDGLVRDLFQDPRFVAIAARDLHDGQHRNPTDRLDYFTTAYFHRPAEAVEEVRGAGFPDPRIFGIEGPGWLLSDADKRMEDPRRRADLLMAASVTEREPALSGISAHLLVVAQKPA
ncbi:MAG TPA: methyltransferase domain-containing protein [Gemmatimonadales bacterium]|nr:methyltransferase domain-containing protein [Gemmatimonadales bacterium]